jgi:hypothetical protein
MTQKKSRTTEWRQRRAAQDIATHLTDNDGLPMHGRVDGRLTTAERAEYRERRRRHLQRHHDYDAGWGRPTPATAKAVWDVLADSLEVQLTDIHPDPLTTQQLLVVALDLAVCAGRYAALERLSSDVEMSRRPLQRTVTKTRLFDALARRWSDHYRLAREKGRAFRVRDMREDTVRLCRRDLLLNDISFDALWKLITGPWSRKRGRNPLFWVNRAPKQKGNWRGYNVLLRPRSPVLKEFERLVRADTQYDRLDGVLRVWIEGQERPSFGSHTDIAAEVKYNAVSLGEQSETILKLQDDTRILFNVDAFKADYKRMVPAAKARRRELREKRSYPKKPTAGMAAEKRPWTLEERRLLVKYRQAHSFVLGLQGVYEQVRDLSGDVPIRSEFYRVLNRRFQAAHFWPLAASNTLDSTVPDEDVEKAHTSSRDRWFAFPGWVHPVSMIGMDISSSQTQILAVLLGCEELEHDATSGVPFKETLARLAWEYNTTHGGLLRDGYADVENYGGPDDRRLIELTKSLWMKRLYGSQVRRIVRTQSWDPDTFGPGWVYTTQPTWSTVQVERFLETVPYYHDVERFLNACVWIGENADEYNGVTFEDPLDHSTFTWNPVARSDRRLVLDGLELTVSLPRGAEKNGRYPVQRDKLGRMVAPCLVHMLDAFYSALVMEELNARGAKQFIAVHDAWFVPTLIVPPNVVMEEPADPDDRFGGALIIPPDGRPLQFGPKVLEAALRAAGERWLRGLGPVYNRLCELLRPHPDFGPMIRAAREKWEDRVNRQDWPKFAAKRVKLFTVHPPDPAE